jgi:putative spermidine/putrescine transport system substrate-binding protein
MDLWNQKEFPGPRCLQKAATDNLELGALHAGASRNSVYPIDQEAAYRELDKLKSNVAVWWTTGAQSVQALTNHDCVMGTAWNGRPYALGSQANLGLAWDDAIFHVGWWAIPKGAPHPENALKLLAYMQNPAAQAAVAEDTGYAGGAKKTSANLSAKVKPYFAGTPAHLRSSLMANDKWWAANGAAAEDRFTTWVTR